jgi:hypothetical protein
MAKEKKQISDIEETLSDDELRLRGDIVTFEDEIKSLDKIREEFTDLTKALNSVGLKEFVEYLYSPWRIIWSNLLAGIFRGLGIIIGMTVVFGLLIWILGKFVNFPLIGEYFLQMKTILEAFAPDATIAK